MGCVDEMKESRPREGSAMPLRHGEDPELGKFNPPDRSLRINAVQYSQSNLTTMESVGSIEQASQGIGHVRQKLLYLFDVREMNPACTV